MNDDSIFLIYMFAVVSLLLLAAAFGYLVMVLIRANCIHQGGCSWREAFKSASEEFK